MGELLDKAKGKFREVADAISGHKTEEMKDAVYEQKDKLERDVKVARDDIKEGASNLKETASTFKETTSHETSPMGGPTPSS